MIVLGAHRIVHTRSTADEDILRDLDQRALKVGSYPGLVALWCNMTWRPEPAPRGRLAPTPRLLDGIAARGAIPMLFVETDAGDGQAGFGLEEWIAGSHDTKLYQLADGLDGWPGSVIVRIDQEMDGKHFPWAGDPVAFVAMWQHVVSRLKDGADRLWLHWCSTALPGSTAYWPGDAYVDFRGFTCYDSQGDGFPDLSTKIIRAIANQPNSSAPIIVSESGIKRLGSNDRVRARSLDSLATNLPGVCAIALMDMDLRQSEPTNDWRITGEMLRSYGRLLEHPAYEAGGFPWQW
jgi:hypothetical protein